jgi:uncharacterized SAM-binding protein YcdF (DUF218 family)
MKIKKAKKIIINIDFCLGIIYIGSVIICGSLSGAPRAANFRPPLRVVLRLKIHQTS